MKIKNYILLFVLIAVSAVSLASPSFSDVAAAVDPSAYTPSARVLGMGRAYVGLADDAAGIYLNPAGIASATNWKLSSMSGKFVEDYDYLSVSGIYPTNFGVIGVGYDTYTIAGAYATTIDARSDPDDPIPIIDLNTTTMSNYNTVFLLSYGTKLSRLFRTSELADKVSLGANFKSFSAGLSGDHIVNGGATGQELDLGILYQANPWFSLGSSLLNALPMSAGGKLRYTNGHEENFPAQLKVGTAIRFINPEDSPFKFGNQKLTVLLDADYWPTLKNWPMTAHTGLEWSPFEMLAIRAGFDQTAAGNGSGGYETISDLTMGVGLVYSGVRFDYAYHQFAAVPGSDNHTFSLSFDAPSFKITKSTGRPITLESPMDKTLTYSTEAEVKGSVNDLNKIKSLLVNGSDLRFSPKGVFYATAPLKAGKNKISINGLDRFKTVVTTEDARMLRLASYPDVMEGSWAQKQISFISMLNIVTGYPDGTFRPEGNITRAEMAALLMRSNADGVMSNASHYALPITHFADVKDTHWASKYIADAASAHVVEGYPDKTFRPSGSITRAEGLAMIARFAKISQEAYTQQYFPDISYSYWAAPIIAGSSKAGLLEYLQGRAFEPKRRMTRAEAVEILYRTQFVKGLLDHDLLNWESY